MKNLEGKCRSAIDRYNMISDGDRIAVGLSGGKDSLSLIYLLSELRNYYPHKFDVLAITVDPSFLGSETDFNNVTQFCENLKIKHIVKRTELYDIIFKRRKENNPCSLCSRMRQGIIHNMALEKGCNKVALGHNLDDAVETFLMNLLNGGQVSCFSPKSFLSKKKLWLIRPLVFCNENDINNFAIKNNFPVLKSKCPVDGNTQRQKTKDLIAKLDEEYSNVRKKIIGAMIKNKIDDWG